MNDTSGRDQQYEQEIREIFLAHPDSHLDEENQPVIPGDALVDILRTFSTNHDAELLSKDEEEKLTNLVENNPGLAVTPQILLQFIAMRTTTISPKRSPEGSPPSPHSELDDRGRDEDREEYYDHSRSYSRSSSRSSSGTSGFGPPSRPPSRGPPVPPKTPIRDSPFESSRRQRSQPLANQAPSSWTRRPPPSRRKSDAGTPGRAMSDSESPSSPPVAFSRSEGQGSRSRAPSNPGTPLANSNRSFSPTSIGSPPFGGQTSRPHSRAQSQPQGHFSSLDGFVYGSSPERDFDLSHLNGLLSPPPSDQSENSFDNSFDNDDTGFIGQISSLPMPRRSSSDSDSDGENEDDTTLGLVYDRSAASSTVSMDMQERMEALQRTNAELGRKLMEAERTLQKRLSEHEFELEEMQSRLEEAKSELSATKREEKELRSKERNYSTQISALESEIAKLQKSLENARQSYTSLRDQYQEQCAESERYRNAMRSRDDELKELKDNAMLHALEVQKWLRDQGTYEARIEFMESELMIAQQAQAALEEQKQENLMLKETIDRMRFDMDEMRASAASGHQHGGSGASSVRGSVSKSLGAELLSKMKDGVWEMEAEEEHAQPEQDPELEMEDDDTEGEDVIQTIITRTKRKVTSRAKRMETIKVDELKEYSDAAVQHDVDSRSLKVQTDSEPKVLTASFSVQTDEPSATSMSIQTEPETTPIPVITTDAEIQTDEPEPEPSTSSTPRTNEDDNETMASSSSTLLPPTPKAQPEPLHVHNHDLPPAYNQVAEDELALRVANETLKQWHKGLKFPIEPLASGISEDAIEDWKALKEELGVECSAIDKLVEESARTGLPRSPRDKDHRNPNPARARRGRFYNIYNTYVYGDKDGGSSPRLSHGQFLFCLGASAAVAFLVGHAMAPQYTTIPGGATYYDRAAWSSFNSMQAAGEGFPGDSTSIVWGLLGRLGGGAARTLRGWPT